MQFEKPTIEKTFSASQLTIFNKLDIPIALANNSLELIWCSKKFNVLIEGNIIGVSIKKLLDIPDDDITQSEDFINDNLFWETRISKYYAESEHIGYIVYLEIKNQQSEKITKRFKAVKSFAHDLNNILTSLANSASLLNSTDQNSEKFLSLINNIESNSQRASDLIHNVLASGSAGEVVKKKIDLQKLFQELKASLQNYIKKDIHLDFDIQRNVHPVTANYSDIYRLLLNLCINAEEAIKKRGRIKIRAYNDTYNNIEHVFDSKAKDFVVIKVEDNGSGIRRKHIDKIFDPNFSTKKRDRDSGFGLNIAKEIVKDHNGHINVKSRWLFGTQFSIYLPAREMFEKSDLTATSDYKIMIADDELSILELLTDLLESYNYTVLRAENGSELLKLYRKFPDVDLMIIDRKMPELDGIECIKKLRELNFTKPIILTSGSQSISQDNEINSISIQKIMTKPYDFEELLSEIRFLLS